MRKFIIFALLFAAGLFLLLRLDKSSDSDPQGQPQVDNPNETPPRNPNSLAGGEPEQTDRGTDASSTEGTSEQEGPSAESQTTIKNLDGWTPTYRGPDHIDDLTGDVVVGIFGGFSTSTYNEETGKKDGSIQWEHSEPVGDPTDLFYLMIDVEIRFQDAQTSEETMVLKAQKVRGQLDMDEGGGVQNVGGEQDLEMREVGVDVLTGHALAPFRLTAQNMRATADLDHFAADGEEPVVLTGQGLHAKGWNLTMDRSSGQVDFLRGGEFEFQEKGGDTIRFKTEKGTPLHFTHTKQGETDRFQLRVLGGGVLSITGENDWRVESQGLTLRVTKDASGQYILDQLDTSGMVRATRGEDVFSGSGVRLVQSGVGTLLDLHIANNPKAELLFDESEGSKVEVRGSGPMVVHAENKESESEQAELELRGGGSILFPREQNPLEVTFREKLTLWVDRLHQSGTFAARGRVHISQGEAWLKTDALESIVWSAQDQVVDVTCEGSAKARLHGSEHGDLNFEASQGAMLQVKGEAWKFPQASGVYTTRLGNTPLEIRADEVRDLDWDTHTFRAWGKVSMQNPLGSMSCDRIQARDDEHLSLFGTPNNPAELDLISGVSFFKEVLSGNLSAVEIQLKPDEIVCIGQVEASLDTTQGKLQYSSDRLAVNVALPETGPEEIRIFSEGSTNFRWDGEEGEQIRLACANLHLNGQGQLSELQNDMSELEDSEPSLFSLRAEDVSNMSWITDENTRTIVGKLITLDGSVAVVKGRRKAEVRSLRADGGFAYMETGGRRLDAVGESLKFDGESKLFKVEPVRGGKIVATGLLPQMALPFRITATSLSISETELLAENPELDVNLSVLPVGEKGIKALSESHFRADRLSATSNLLKFTGSVLVRGSDLTGAPLKLSAQRLTLDGDLRSVTDGDVDLQSMDELRAEGGFELEYGNLAKAQGDKLVILPSLLLMVGTSTKRVRVELDGFYLETERLEANLDDFLITTDRGVMRGGQDKGEWSLEYASLQPIQRGGETMFAMVSPTYSQDFRTARSNWAMVWINLETWRDLGRAALWGEPLPERPDWTPHEVPNAARPDLIQNFLASLASEDLPHYVRAVLLEGDVEASIQDRRVVRADSLYADVSGCQAWLEQAEISKLLRLRDQDHKLRIKTNLLVAQADGSLRANTATITSCDHEEPHYVVEVGKLRLLPRQDQRWKFSAVDNRIAFQNGMGLPMPSIRNVILDSQGGFEGFENEQGEVTTVENIALQNTPRFGTILGTSLAYDIGSVGKVLASALQFDSDEVRGRWRVEGSWLSSRGPLLGLGLQLRERGRERANREEFWLDVYARGIPDDGNDRGMVRIPENETSTIRHWINARGRYPFGDRQWLDVVFNQQGDAGVQAEFFQKDYQRFEERESYVHWRKARDGHFFNARVQVQSDDFRTEVERKPSIGAFRGLAELFRMGNLPVNYSASANMEYLTRREGDARFENEFLNAGGVADGLGERSTLRADTNHRIEIPIPTGIRGTKLTPFVNGRFTAWDKGVDPTDNPSRFAIFGGARLQGVFTRASGVAYHTLIPRIEVAHELDLEQSGGSLVGFDSVEDALDGDRIEVGVRSLWHRPDQKHWLDFDASVSHRINREGALPDTEQLRFLGGARTQFGSVPVGFEQDLRQDLESNKTLYSRTILAVQPTESLLMQLGHQHGWEETGGGIFETASLDLRFRISQKWELGVTNYTNIQDGGNLASEFTLRRFSHDFVLELEVTRYAGEGGTGIGLNFAPLLAWKPSSLGILDRR